MKKALFFCVVSILVFLLCGNSQANFYEDEDFDGVDFYAFLSAYGSSTGLPNYDRDADFNKDGNVDLSDLNIAASIFGSTGCMIPALKIPDISAPLLSDMPYYIGIPTCYAGFRRIDYSLIEGPAGMELDTDNGVLSWTPPKTMEGSNSLVKVTVTDGNAIDEIEFTVAVALTTPIETSVNENTITVTETGNLTGFSVTLPDQRAQTWESGNIAGMNSTASIDDIEISKLTEDQIPPIPEGVTRLTDFFRVSPTWSLDESIKITFPQFELPEGRYPFELILCVYTETINYGSDNDYSWISTQQDINIDSNGSAVIEIAGLGDLSFIGILDQGPESASPISTLSEDTIAVNCVNKIFDIPFIGEVPSPFHHICKVDGDSSLEVEVQWFILNQWDDDTIAKEDLARWIFQAKLKLDDPEDPKLSLRYDPKITVIIHQMDETAKVTPSEDFRTIHVDKDATITKDLIKAAIAHEFFHHAQSRTKEPEDSNLAYVKELNIVKWLIEGTAVWFEDHLFDDTIPDDEISGIEISDIMSEGFDAIHITNGSGAAMAQVDNPNYSYYRYAMWKLIFNKCDGFNFFDILNISDSDDSTGVINLADKLKDPSWMCDFGYGLGDDYKNTLANAILSYQYAILKIEDLSYIESGEGKISMWPGQQSEQITLGKPPNEFNDIEIPANGAKSYQVNSMDSLEIGKAASITAEVKGAGNAFISIMEPGCDPLKSGGSCHWFETNNQNELIIPCCNNSCSDLFVTFVNPSTSEPITINWSLGLREIEIDLDTCLIAHYEFENNLDDSSGNGHHGNDGIVGNPQFVTGVSGYALELDGDDAISIPNHDSLNFGTNDFTISSWVRTTSALPYETIVSKHWDGGPGEHGYYLGLADGKPRFMKRRDNTTSLPPEGIRATEAINNGLWHHVVGVRQGDTMKLYVDGICPPENVLTGASTFDFTSPTTLNIGAQYDSNEYYKVFLEGELDEIGIYNRALSGNEIDIMYHQDKP